MRQAMLPHSWIGLVSCLATVMFMSACTTFQSPAVQLDQSVHFVTPAGTDVVVKPGVYRVEPAGDSEIQLLSDRGTTPVVLHAEAVSELSSPPDAPASDPTAMIMIFEPDAYDVVLRQRGRPALAAHGSVSGTQSRALVWSSPRQSRYEAKGAVDLLGCIGHYTQRVCGTCSSGLWSCACISKTRYYFKITNLGNATAGPSKSRFSNASESYTYDVSSTAPGTRNEYGWSVWGWTEQEMGPKPWKFSVDVENAVAEVNEGNNTSGECP